MEHRRITLGPVDLMGVVGTPKMARLEEVEDQEVSYSIEINQN